MSIIEERRGKGGAAQKHSTDISIFRALSFPIYFFISRHPLGSESDFSLLLSSLGLMRLLIPTLHPSPPSPADPRSTPSLLPFPFLTSLSPALFPHVSPLSTLLLITTFYLPLFPCGSASLTKVSLEARVCNTNDNTLTAHFNNRYQKNWSAYVFDESVPESCFPFKKEEQKEYLA